MEKLESLTDFLIETNSLKKTIRYESCPLDVQEPTAGHSWNVCRMIPLVARELGLKINIQHAMEIANVHDLAEYSLKNDFDSYLVSKGVSSKAEKDKSEEETMASLRARFNVGESVHSLWKEYGECKTSEARFVKALDKIESHFHIIACDGFDDLENLTYQITYADNAVRNFPELSPLLSAAKKKLKTLIEVKGITWKSEYNYPD
jgi:5'-deoxynucleotidase YfbR-like HD superfamily hydrolase